MSTPKRTDPFTPAQEREIVTCGRKLRAVANALCGTAQTREGVLTLTQEVCDAADQLFFLITGKRPGSDAGGKS